VAWSTDEKSQASEVTQPYNLQLGPVSLRAEADISTSLNDNINLARNGRSADFITNPSVGIHGLWQVTESNALTLDIGVGYEFYAIHSQDDNFTIAPDSLLSFNMSVGETQINLHNKFSYQQDPLLVGQLSNSSRFPVFMNDAGIKLSWDLNDLTPSVGYDHINQLVFEKTYSYLDYQEDSISPQISLKLNPTISAGLSSTFSSTRYDEDVENNNISIMSGPFVNAQITDNFSVNAQVGYISTIYATGGSNGDTEDINSFYGSVGVSHRLNQAITESLTAGRDYLPGLTSNFTERLYANYVISWQAQKFLNLSANLSVENLKDSSATISENSNQFQGGLNLDYTLSTQATIKLSYQYTLKDSNISDLSFYQNLITAGYRYKF
jgi:hypothetical protein